MKHVLVLAVASLVATSANAAEMKWSGSTGWRYEQTKNNDNRGSTLTVGTAQRDTSKQTTKAHQIRANLGVTGGWDNVEWGFGVRTGGASVNDDHMTLTGNTDRALGIEQAWFRYVRDFGSLDMNVTIGRQKNVLAYDTTSQTLFDNDVRWDGAGWQFKFGMFGMNAAQYILGAKSGGLNGASTQSKTEATEDNAAAQAKFNYLLAFQPYMNWKFSDEIETMFAVGYYLWSDDSNTNVTNAGVDKAYNNGTTNPDVGTSTMSVANSKQWHFVNTWTLPYNLSFNAEYVMNKKRIFDSANVAGYAGTVFPEASRSAWSAGLTYGALKKARDFSIGYAYGTKGIASVINRYTYEKFAADNKGHTISVGYAIADNFHLGWKGMFLKEKELLNAVGGAGVGGVALANGQNMKTTYWELTAGVMF